MYIYTRSRSHTRKHQKLETSSADRISCPLHHDRCVPAVRQIHIHVYTNTHAHTHTHTHTTHTSKHTHTQIHTLTLSRTLTHTRSRAHTHTCLSVLRRIFSPMMLSFKALQYKKPLLALQNTATHCNTLQHTATQFQYTRSQNRPLFV